MPPKIAPMDIPHIQELVCRSLSSQDIYQCTLVSRNWHKNLNRFLWRSITLRTKGALRRFLASPQAQNAPQLSYLIENLTSPYPDIFSRFLSTVVTRHTKDTRQDGRDASEDSQDSHPDVSVLEDLHRLFGETLLAQPSFQVSTSVTCQFNRLTELRSTYRPSLYFSKLFNRHLCSRSWSSAPCPWTRQRSPGQCPLFGATHLLKSSSSGAEAFRVSDIRSTLCYSTHLKKFTWLQHPQRPVQMTMDCELVYEARIQELQSLFPGSHPSSVDTFHYADCHTAAALASYRLEELDLRTAPIPHDFTRNLFLPFLRGYCPNLKRLVYPWIPGNDDPELDFDPYLPGLPMVLNDGMTHLRHIDFRNVNHTVDETMETILESCHELETFYGPAEKPPLGTRPAVRCSTTTPRL
ncbi:hypothetical protein BG003_008133 [Podila horticola]|nr:hypothetical protein BG003_008133 [Podila horticola]